MGKPRSQTRPPKKKPKRKIGICPNCGHSLEKGGHFVPPSLGDPGFYACENFCEECKNESISKDKKLQSRKMFHLHEELNSVLEPRYLGWNRIEAAIDTAKRCAIYKEALEKIASGEGGSRTAENALIEGHSRLERK